MMVIRMSDLDKDFQKEIQAFNSGQAYRLHRFFGPQKLSENGQKGYRLTVWAPHAHDVLVVSDFTDWQEGLPLSLIEDTGIWTGFFAEAEEGDAYKFKLIQADGEIKVKQDPFAFKFEVRPKDASIIKTIPKKEWQDQTWMDRRSKVDHLEAPLNIYEVHLSSWKHHDNGDWYSIKDLKNELIPYVKDLAYTHIQFMPLMEHPLDASWGYQVTGFYALSSKYGEIEEFQDFVEEAHRQGIGVIVDWVPSHFNRNDYAMAYFDGTPCFEYEDPMRANNNRWGTLNFDLGKAQVHSFLISNASYWIETFHLDGIRMDAVSNMLYLDYDEGEWKPNEDGSNHNRQGLAFLQKFNKRMQDLHPAVLMIAEESTAWAGVTASIEEGGLAFDFKWNMGWMNDTLEFFEMDPEYRKHHFDLITFSFFYTFNERFILALSHDEVVHGKKSLQHKMFGDYYNEMASLRTLETYRMTHPGKKLNFMGAEFAQHIEWRFYDQLDWLNLQNPVNQKHLHFIRELNQIYADHRSLWELDHDGAGLEILQADKPCETVLTFIRRGRREDDFLIIACNFRPHQYDAFRIGVPQAGTYKEILNTEMEEFGGTWTKNQGIMTAKEVENGVYYNQDNYIELTLPAMSSLIIKPVKSQS